MMVQSTAPAARRAGAASRAEVDWHAVDWHRVNQNVRRLQARIVQATQEGRWGRVKALQRLLTHSFSGKALAVRRVTENRGKDTPGVDGATWDTPAKKATAIGALRQRGYRPRPLRRVYIPKKHGKLRPLGIPTMADRAMQALYLLALDPIAETTGDPNSYGFRKERATADAIVQCYTVLAKRASPRWVLEGDIKACFDRISHAWLLAHVPLDKAILRTWLEAGFMERHVLYDTTEGTPQGGITTLPTIWQTIPRGMLRVQIAADPEDDRDLPVVDLHALDQRPDELPLRGPLGGRQPILHLRGERLEAVHHEAELALEAGRVGQFAGLRFQHADALPQAPDPGLELLLLDQALRVAVDQPRQPLPQLLQLCLRRGAIRCVRGRGIQPAAIFVRQALGMLEQAPHLGPHGRIQAIRPHLRVGADALATEAVGIGSKRRRAAAPWRLHC
jgi:hypothetical protein